MAKITWKEPYETVRGKFSKKSELINKLTPTGQQIAHRQGVRNVTEHPVTQDELAAHALFKKRQAMVAERRKPESSTYLSDLAAFKAQKAQGGYTTFVKYLWSLAMAQFPA